MPDHAGVTYGQISCNDAMVLSADNPDIKDHGFGLAINIVNNGCSDLKAIINEFGQPYKKASDDNANRAQWYQVFTYAFGISP